MKRSVIAALAVITAMCCTACGGSDKNDSAAAAASVPAKSETTAADDTDTPADTSADAVTETAPVSPETPDETDVSKPDGPIVVKIDDPDKAESKAPESGSTENKAASFTFNADSSKWKITQDGSSAAITYNGDDIDYAKGNCTIMINSRIVEDMADRTLGEVADAIIDSKGLTDSVEIVSRGESVLGGHDGYTLSCVYTANNIKFDLDITVLAEDTQVLEVWVMSYQDCTDAMQDNFDEVLKTIEFA